MDKKQFTDFCNAWKAKGAHDFTRKSHYEEMAPLFEPHAEVVEVTASDFHNLGTSNGVTTYYPKKETTDRFGAAAGLSFSSVNIGTRKDSPLCFVGKAQCTALGPDGQTVNWAPAEYEYDAEVRAEEEILKNLKSYKEGSKYHPSKGESAELEKKSTYLQHRKVARRRADTGARAAAIISAIGMPTGFKDIFKAGGTAYFLFSRVIYNAKNKMVMDRALDAMFGASKAIAGPSAAALLEDATDKPDVIEDDMVDVHPAVYETFDDEPPFEDDPESLAALRASLKDLRDKHNAVLSDSARAKIDETLGNQSASLSDIQSVLGRLHDFLDQKGVKL